MNHEIIIPFIKRGMNYDDSTLRKGALAFWLFCLIALGYGIILGGLSLILAILMQLNCLFNTIAIYSLTAKQRTLRKRLWINLLFPLSMILGLLLFCAILFINYFGPHIALLALPLPVILTGGILLLLTQWGLKKDHFNRKKNARHTVAVPLVTTGVFGGLGAIFGRRIGQALFKDASQLTLLIFLSSALMLIACFLTVGLKNILRLRYLKTLEARGIFADREITPGIIWVQKITEE